MVKVSERGAIEASDRAEVTCIVTEVHRWQYQSVEASPAGCRTGEWWTC